MIRAASPADIDALLDIENEAFGKQGMAMTRRSFRRFINNGTADLLVAQRRGKVVGYALVTYRPTTARLYSLAVSRNVRTRGIGKKLLRAAEARAAERAKSMFLEVHERNSTAQWLYLQSGYVGVDRIERYYPDGGAALKMSKVL